MARRTPFTQLSVAPVAHITHTLCHVALRRAAAGPRGDRIQPTRPTRRAHEAVAVESDLARTCNRVDHRRGAARCRLDAVCGARAARAAAEPDPEKPGIASALRIVDGRVADLQARRVRVACQTVVARARARKADVGAARARCACRAPRAARIRPGAAQRARTLPCAVRKRAGRAQRAVVAGSIVARIARTRAHVGEAVERTRLQNHRVAVARLAARAAPPVAMVAGVARARRAVK